jgi:ribose 5-phosphate isomerase B
MLMRIAIGADHRGYIIKTYLKENEELYNTHIDWIDVGCSNGDYCDYPPYAIDVAQLIQNKEVDLGILICGTGIGMAITANRFINVYAGLVCNVDAARLARQHDNVNVLVLPADFISNEDASQMVSAWMSAEFLAGKYQNRLDMIDAI